MEDFETWYNDQITYAHHDCLVLHSILYYQSLIDVDGQVELVSEQMLHRHLFFLTPYAIFKSIQHILAKFSLLSDALTPRTHSLLQTVLLPSYIFSIANLLARHLMEIRKTI